MSIQGILFHPTIDRCPYLDNMVAISENLRIQKIDTEDMESFLNMGFRHFGEVFFRPICAHCRSCIPIRIPVNRYQPTRSVKRLFNRTKHLNIAIEEPQHSEEMYHLYKKHKKRFKEESPINDSYEIFIQSFCHPFPFNKMLTIRDGEKLVAVSHLDVTANTMSAIYCYYDEAYARYSPGKLAILKEIMLCKEMNIQWYYLGYFIEKNRHTNYKILYKPNQVLVKENHWIDYIDAQGVRLNPLPQPSFRLLADYSK